MLKTNSDKTKSIKNKLMETRRHCIATMIKILKWQLANSQADIKMTGNYRDGYLMGLSDAIEAIEDRALWSKYKNKENA